MFGTNKVRSKNDYDPAGQLLAIQSIFHTIQGEGPFAGRPAVFLRLAGCNLRCHFCDTDFESKWVMHDHQHIAALVRQAAKKGNAKETNLVVITGGEPFLQNLIPLLNILCKQDMYEVQVETAGTVWVDGLEPFANAGIATIVCSPKTGKVHPKIEEHCFDWKYLIQEGQIDPVDGLPNQSTQVPGKSLRLFRPTPHHKSGYGLNTIWLQPCEAYKVDYKKVGFLRDGTEPADFLENAPLADQQVTSSVRDEEQSQRNMKLCGELAMKFNYRVSVQLHKILGLP